MKNYILMVLLSLVLMPTKNLHAGGHDEHKKLTAASSGFEGREEMLGRAMTVVLKSLNDTCLLYTSPSPRDQRGSRMPSSA